MSETVHYRGKATKIDQPFNKTLIQVAEGILEERGQEIPSYSDNAVEAICDLWDNEFFLYAETQTLFRISKEEHELDEEILYANKCDDGTIDFELRWYNGGASFNECLSEAMDKL